MTSIIISDRTEGMVDASANCYQESKIFKAIQNAQALEYDRLYADTQEIGLQLSPFTATWGLVYWEMAVGISPNHTGDYELRRPPILAKMLSATNFGVPTIASLASNYGEKVDVSVDISTYTVTITFQNGIPPFLKEFQDTVRNLIHAHLGTKYTAKYLTSTGIHIGACHTLAPTLMVYPYLQSDYQSMAGLYVGLRHTITSDITIHPYLLGTYNIAVGLQVGSRLLTATTLVAHPRLTSLYTTSVKTGLAINVKTGYSFTIDKKEEKTNE